MIDKYEYENEKNFKKKKNKEFFLFPVNKSNKKKSNRNKNKEKNNNKDNKDNYKKDNKHENKIENQKEKQNENQNKDDINKNINQDELKKNIDYKLLNKNNIISDKENNINKNEFSNKYNSKDNKKESSNININNILVKTNETNIEFTGNKKKTNLREYPEENINLINVKSKNIYINKLNIKNELNIIIKSDKEANDEEINKNKLNLYNQYFTNVYNIYQSQYPNIIFYPNCNNSIIFQNKLFSILGEEILNLEKKVDNNLKVIKPYRELTINKLKEFISKILKKEYDFEFLFYGSYSTGLSIEISDIDILIRFKLRNKNNINELNCHQNIEDIISLLEKEFNKNKYELKITQINPIYTASVPVFKIEFDLKDIIPENIQNELNKNYLFNFENEIIKLNFDLTFNEVNNLKDKQQIPSQEIIKYIKNVLDAYPNIRPILLVLKRFLQIKKLNSSFHGGISSYSLFLLLYAYYLHIYGKNENNINKEYFKTNLGGELLGFFSFYGNLNFGIYSIDVKNANPMNLLDKLHEYSILLVDPITRLNVAKSTFRIEQIKYLFNNAVMTINTFYYKNLNNIKSNEEINILKEIFNSFNYNGNIFIPNESSLSEWNC